MGIGNLYDDGNVLGETREVQLAADLIHPSGGGGARCGRRQRKGHSLLNLREYRRKIFFFFPLLPLCHHHNPHHHTAHFMTIS